MEADADAWGITIEDVQRDPAPSLWPEQVTAWNVFAACSTQWRVIAGQAAVIHQGIDYAALESVMRMHAVGDTLTVFSQVRSIEAGALEVINR